MSFGGKCFENILALVLKLLQVISMEIVVVQLSVEL